MALSVAELAVTVALAKAAEGVDFDTKNGAPCPLCGVRMRVVCTRQWEGGTRLRFHRCENKDCLMCRSSGVVKSVQSAHTS